jgi:hypothetical protein
MTQSDRDYVVSDVEYNVITTLSTLLQSEDVLAGYTEDAEQAGEEEIAALFKELRAQHRTVARGLRAVLLRNLSD